TSSNQPGLYVQNDAVTKPDSSWQLPVKSLYPLKNPAYKSQQQRAVVPQQVIQPEAGFNKLAAQPSISEEGNLSKLAPSETEFRQLIGEAAEGSLARFVDNKLSVLFWHRSSHEPRLVFGTQLSLARLKAGLQTLMAQFEPAFREEICITVLDDKAKPVASSL